MEVLSQCRPHPLTPAVTADVLQGEKSTGVLPTFTASINIITTLAWLIRR